MNCLKSNSKKDVGKPIGRSLIELSGSDVHTKFVTLAFMNQHKC